ncbi:hypothetical protein L3X38_028706 [Prunus dulcis]|uniref:Uncharacterized protein n=1 Tax=Prunus dulcis TaxID=3755 RepID=A0AAD4VQ95_PRUDU|nr:hypothetical protein L3X38_028706 [Prunus dulcis]
MKTINPFPIHVTPRTSSAVARYCPLWAWLHSHQPARFCFWELTKQLPRVVTHPGIAPASNSLNFGVPTNPKPVSSQKASHRFRVAQRTGPNSTYYDIVRFGTHDWALTGLFLGRTTFSCAPKRPRAMRMRGYCPLWAWLHSHQPARFCFWELTKQLPRVVTHPGIAPASNSLNFGVPTNPKPVSSQKASHYLDARVVTHPGIAPASNSLNFGVPTNPKPVSSQKASHYLDARCAI